MATLVTPNAARVSLRFLVLMRWILLLLAPLMFGLTEMGSNGSAMWWVIGAFALVNLLMQIRLRYPMFDPHPFWLYSIFATDLFLITAIVVVRGGLRTDTYLLYLLVMCEVGIVLGQRQAWLALGMALGLYGGAVLLDDPHADLARLVIRFIYMSLVGLTTAYLAAAQKRALIDSLTDSKTNLPNFRHFREALDEAVRRHQLTRQPLTVAILDVDNFRQLNSVIGHPLADKVLEQLAGLLEASKRKGDLLARYGGEEFIMLLPDTDADGAVAALDRIRVHVAEQLFELGHGHEPIHISISAGVAELRSGEPESPLLVQADQALVEAKTHGKNCVRRYA